MTLSEVKTYLVGHRRATLSDIAIHFGSTPDAARQLLRHWLDKGRVRKLGALPPCGGKAGCCCTKAPEEIYEWVQ